jgi:hypothetical protein
MTRALEYPTTLGSSGGGYLYMVHAKSKVLQETVGGAMKNSVGTATTCEVTKGQAKRDAPASGGGVAGNMAAAASRS